MSTVQTGEVKSVSILDFSSGAINERVAVETKNILANILDPNTTAKEKRVLTVKIELTPTEDRKTVSMKTTITSKLASYAPVETSANVGGTMEQPIAVEWNPQVPGQTDFTGGETQPPKVIDFSKAM